MADEIWRVVPAIEQNGFRGMTELRVGDRYFQLGGTDEATRMRLRTYVRRVLAEEEGR